jgi:riboflavin kinase / FMN hydrolase
LSWRTERATRDVLTEFLAAYGKVPDAREEEKRLGQMYLESTTGIIRDYGLPLTVDEYSKAMYPLYLKRFLFTSDMYITLASLIA